MSRVYFISDLHLGHKGALIWAKGYRGGESIEEHDSIIVDRICKTVNKRDVLYILGDVVWKREVSIHTLSKIPCTKVLVRGNHDDGYTAAEYLEVFKDIVGIAKYKKHWISHAPVHPHLLSL